MKKIFVLLLIIIGTIFIFYKFGNPLNHIPESVSINESEEIVKKIEIELYYYNQSKDKNNDCSDDFVLPVKREIENTATPVRDSIELLLRGEVTEEEKEEGFNTEFPDPDFKLISANLSDGKLTLLFNEVPGFTSGGSCRVSLLASQIKKTALQFNEVKEVIIQPDSIFQP